MFKVSDRTERLIEFAVIGLVMGISEDLLAVWIATDAEITWNVIVVVTAVAIPFAFISEFVVDHPQFWRRVIGMGRKKKTLDGSV